jgi:hypothetical protein
MAVEIKELVIRAVVDYRQESEKNSPGASSQDRDLDQEAIVEACVRRVLKILNRSNKR